MHHARIAYVYVRQSTMSQVDRNTESTDRQYKLLQRALELGWEREKVSVVDDDLGISGSGTVARSGFERMTADVAFGRVGIVLALEVSRLARNNSDWYRLLDLCALTDTLIADYDGLYHPGHFNDRLVLGLKGTMSEAELHILRARLNGGIKNKAARGELRRGLPVGYVWGEEDGEVCFDPDEAVTAAIRAVFERFAELGSARRVWLWLRSEGLELPTRRHMRDPIQWGAATYTRVHQILTNPVYAGVYAYGKSRHERYVDEHGNVRKRSRKVPQSQWEVFLPEHHEGFVDWETFEAIQQRLAKNTRPRPHTTGGALREGCAWLQGLATCGRCGRTLRVYYSGKGSRPGYHCPGSNIANGRGVYCLRVGGVRIDQAVASAFLEAIQPAGLQAALQAEKEIEEEHDAALAQHRLRVERADYEAKRADRRYKAVDPDNRLVARGLEAEWEERLRRLHEAQAELAKREQQRPRPLTDAQRQSIAELGQDVTRVWSASTTTDRDRKELLHTLLEEVSITVDRESHKAHLLMRWEGGALQELDVDLWRARHAPNRTDEETVDLIRRLALHYKDAMIAGILNRQGRRTASGKRFTANRVSSLRTHWKIPRFQPSDASSTGPLLTVQQAAHELGVAPSTVHRWLNDGFIAGEQITPGAPWRIRLTDEMRARFVEEERDGYVPMIDATKRLRVSRQTVLHRVQRGELKAILLTRGRRKGLRIKVLGQQNDLFANHS